MRLVDADALEKGLKESKAKLLELYEALKHRVDKQICGGEIASLTEAVLRVQGAPTIEAEPVKHGRWVYDEVEMEWSCSECSREAPVGMSAYILTDYCPYCGAKMEQEETP